jgi:hypothetical protein
MPELGQRAFEVEWATDIPVTEFGDRDDELAKLVRNPFALPPVPPG